MYNEGVNQFARTMGGIARNLKRFHSFGVPLDKIACCVIIDGHSAFFKSINAGNDTRRFFNQFFNENIIKNSFNVNSID